MTGPELLLAFITALIMGWWVAWITARHFFYTAGFHDGYEKGFKKSEKARRARQY